MNTLKKYAVAVCPHDDDNEIKIVKAFSDIQAMAIAVGDSKSWGIEEGKLLPFSNVDDAVIFYLQGDLSVSKPILLSEED